MTSDPVSVSWPSARRTPGTARTRASSVASMLFVPGARSLVNASRGVTTTSVPRFAVWVMLSNAERMRSVWT